MSSANVDLVRSVYAAWEQGDFNSVEWAQGSTGVLRERGAMIYEWVDGMIARVITRQDNDEARALAERLAESRE